MSDRFRINSLFAERLKEHKLVLPDVLHTAGLPPGFFKQEKIYVTTSELFALWRAVGKLSPDPAIGLTMGAESRLERFHPTAMAAVCSRSFRDALQRIARYKQLTCPEEIRIHTIREETSVEFFYLEAKEAQPDILVDLVLAWILSIGRKGTDGAMTPLRVELTRSAQNGKLLEEYFKCPVKFKAARNALIFRRSDLDRPFVTHNEELLGAIGAQLESELQKQRKSPDFVEQVKLSLKRSLAGKRPTIQDVSRELGVSTRTLQRKLRDKGVTFQQIIEEARRELALHYLRVSNVELNGVGFLLGYENANSFFRAFQEWEGMPPGEWRTRHRAKDVGTRVR